MHCSAAVDGYGCPHASGRPLECPTLLLRQPVYFRLHGALGGVRGLQQQPVQRLEQGEVTAGPDLEEEGGLVADAALCVEDGLVGESSWASSPASSAKAASQPMGS